MDCDNLRIKIAGIARALSKQNDCCIDVMFIFLIPVRELNPICNGARENSGIRSP